MKIFFMLLAVALFISCRPRDSNTIVAKSTETINCKNSMDGIEFEPKKTYKNVTEVIGNSIWVEKQGQKFSLALHFQYKDTLLVSESPGCWLKFPYKQEGNKLVVFWNNQVDTKYDPDIVEAVYNADEKYLGKPFMILELVNDTTFSATYPIEQLVKEINNSNKKKVYFPARFNLVQDGEMYD
ncbi:MAG: hypothetical protein K2X37_03120 [Chitinophagaceae bacterium]|nr:hypothetical protein [Chitinophagaceae bacterium]